MFSIHFLHRINQTVLKLWKSRAWTATQAAQPSFELKQCTVPISDVCIIWTQRHCSEQDGHDEQVIVVKEICKCETIAFHVMVCLWISRVIVPLQLGYLHNQLSGLAIMCSPLFAAVFSLQLAPCPIEHLVYAQLLYVYMCYCTTWHGLIKCR